MLFLLDRNQMYMSVIFTISLFLSQCLSLPPSLYPMFLLPSFYCFSLSFPSVFLFLSVHLSLSLSLSLFCCLLCLIECHIPAGLLSCAPADKDQRSPSTASTARGPSH